MCYSVASALREHSNSIQTGLHSPAMVSMAILWLQAVVILTLQHRLDVWTACWPHWVEWMPCWRSSRQNRRFPSRSQVWDISIPVFSSGYFFIMAVGIYYLKFRLCSPCVSLSKGLMDACDLVDMYLFWSYHTVAFNCTYRNCCTLQHMNLDGVEWGKSCPQCQVCIWWICIKSLYCS